MKLIFSVLLITSITTFAQIPKGYYDSAKGEGLELKTELYNIIKNHKVLSYTPGLWNLFNSEDSDNGFLDKYYEKDNTILDVYSENPYGKDPYNYSKKIDQCGRYKNESDCYNREHLIPQVFFKKQSPMVSDAFHIWPTDGKVNGVRDNYPFGVVDAAKYISQNGSKLGNNKNSGYSSGYTGTVFEPIDEFKGDIARAYFYFATRYQENGIQNWNYVMFNGTKDKVFADTFLKILITWHIQDPVSDREIDINNMIYRNQKNRNPYIDHPEYVQKIWGETQLATKDFDYQNRNDIEVYNQTSKSIIVQLKNQKKQIEKISIFTINGEKVKDIYNHKIQNKIQVNFSSPGIYIIKNGEKVKDIYNHKIQNKIQVNFSSPGIYIIK